MAEGLAKDRAPVKLLVNTDGEEEEEAPALSPETWLSR